MCAICCISSYSAHRPFDVVDEPLEDDGSFALVRRCLRILLTKDSEEILPCPYEDIYAGCRSIVTLANKGEGLYGSLKIELEQSVGRIANDLIAAPEKGMHWIVEFVKVCQWFELHVVRLSLSKLRNMTNLRSIVFAPITYDLSGSSICRERPRRYQHQVSSKQWIVLHLTVHRSQDSCLLVIHRANLRKSTDCPTPERRHR
jgi:hypothetical protein